MTPLRPARRAGPAALPLLIAVVLVAAGCAAPATTASTSEAKAGDVAPPLSGTTLDGAPFDLSSFRGRPAIVNFWASWCVPCRDEFPLFKAAASKYSADGLTIVGTVFNDDEVAARAFATKAGATWPSLIDPDGAHARDWRVVAPPQTYFIGRDGKIVSRQIGQLTSADFDRQLAAILK